MREARSTLSRNRAPGAPAGDVAAVVAGNNAFALQLHRRLVQPGVNLMTSPYSVSTALAMLWAGARGDTASQLASALQFTVPGARFHDAFNALDLELTAPAPWCIGDVPFTLRITNTAWLQDGAPFVPAYLDTLAVNYGAGLPIVDFAGDPEGARQAVNAAVARATEQRIQEVLPRGSIDRLVKLVLTNAVYFKGNWGHPFERARTAPGSFRLEGGSDVSVPFMHTVIETRGTVQPAYDAVALPYRCSSFEMLLVAPRAGTFAAFERSLDLAALDGVRAAMAEALVTLSMPRFKFEWGTSLKPTLQALGMKTAFVRRAADLNGIAVLDPSDPLYLADVLQQTFVAVDERGTEAAAATAGIGGSTGGKGEWLRVSLDRPFLFLVRNTTTGQILFLGRVMDPR